jgi:orotidine-5'-phosphate decarboxylase
MAIKLIVALDFDNQTNALTLVDKLDPARCALKIGSEMYTLFGADFVRTLIARKFKIFLDLKFHDIPNTVKHACAASAELGVWMLNVHASGGLAMMQAAREGLHSFGANRPLLIAVTVLTSMGAEELSTIGISTSLPQQVNLLAKLAKEAGLDGVVSSALEVPTIKALCGEDFLTITPGIRLSSASQDDQTRIVTPKDALNAGSDYLVIGRPITQAPNPANVIHEILQHVW